MRFQIWTPTNDTWMPEKCCWLTRNVVGHASWIKQMKWSETITSVCEVENTQSSRIHRVFIAHGRRTRCRLLNESAHTHITEGKWIAFHVTFFTHRRYAVCLCVHCLCRIVPAIHFPSTRILLDAFVLILCSNCCTEAIYVLWIWMYCFDVECKQQPFTERRLNSEYYIWKCILVFYRILWNRSFNTLINWMEKTIFPTYHMNWNQSRAKKNVRETKLKSKSLIWSSFRYFCGEKKNTHYINTKLIK